MALSRTNIGAYASGSSYGTGSFTTSSFTPPANSLLVVALEAVRNGSASNFMSNLTISGGSLTYTKRAEREQGDWRAAVQLYTAPVGASPGSMTITVDCGAINVYQYIVHVFAYEGYDTSSPVGATGTAGGNSATGSLTLNLSATTASDCEVIASCVAQDEPVGNITPGTGYTEIYDTSGDGDGNVRLQSQWASGARSTAVWNSAPGTFGRAAVAIEIKAGSSEVSGSAGVTEAADGLAASAVRERDGAVAAQESGDSLAGSGQIALTGAAAIGEAADLGTGEGDVLARANGTPTEAADALSAAGAAAIAGAAPVLEAGDSIAASGSIALAGAVSALDDDDAADAAAGVLAAATATLSEASDVLSALAAGGGVTGEAAVAEASDVLTASGAVTAAPQPISGGGGFVWREPADKIDWPALRPRNDEAPRRRRRRKKRPTAPDTPAPRPPPAAGAFKPAVPASLAATLSPELRARLGLAAPEAAEPFGLFIVSPHALDATRALRAVLLARLGRAHDAAGAALLAEDDEEEAVIALLLAA